MNQFRILNLENLVMGKSMYEYADTNLVLSGRVKELFRVYPLFRASFFGIVFCRKGYVQLNINGTEHLLSRNEICIFFPTNLLSCTVCSQDCEAWMVGMSQLFFNNIIRKDKLADNTIAFIYNNPVLHLPLSSQGETAVSMLADFLKRKVCDTDTYYKKDLIGHIVSAILCEILIENHRRNIDNRYKCDAETTGRAEVFKKFIKEVSKDDGKHRSVNYYAERLCYTPKYISICVKKVSGRTALEWITEHTMELIKYRLKYSSLSIKEIGNEFEFATPAFFGRYVKDHTGMTPGEYRKSVKAR